jgi:SpoVK/Ycf46/Vps4 family AAA+-type ATPase
MSLSKKKKNAYSVFTHYLDKYQEQKNMSYIDCILLTQSIQSNYYKQYYPYYLSNHSPSSKVDSSYFQWQQEHETTITPSSTTMVSTTMVSTTMVSSNALKKELIKKIKIQIDDPIRDISDILHILDTYPYQEDGEYNIDIKSLHNIREELEQLNAMIGMEKVKKAILQQMIYFIQQLHLTNTFPMDETATTLSLSLDYKHTILSGPPGTGKTEMAKILGKMYSKLGILKNNVFKKVTRNDLVAGYLGQTAIKTKKVVEECLGGVLFLDEAYSLGLDDAFSKECVDTLCEAMSDHRDDLMVIIAGYETELNETFFRINAGMQSRFMWKFTIDKYEPKQLMDIFAKKVLENGWSFSEEYMEEKEKEKEKEKNQVLWFKKNKEHFPNYGRDMELLFSYVKIGHAQRIFGKELVLRKKITKEDLEKGLELFLENKASSKSGSESNRFGGLPMGMYI